MARLDKDDLNEIARRAVELITEGGEPESGRVERWLDTLEVGWDDLRWISREAVAAGNAARATVEALSGAKLPDTMHGQSIFISAWIEGFMAARMLDEKATESEEA